MELSSLSAKNTLQIVRELASEDAAHPSCQEEHTRFQPSSRHVQAPTSGFCPERFGAWLYAETNRQPFYLWALLQDLLERGILVSLLIGGSGWVFELHPSICEATLPNSVLPSDVREMILLRLARLSSPTRNLLAAGAVLGHDFKFEELCRVAQLAAQDGLDALDEALHSRLLRESNQRQERREEVSYHFAHDKIREVVYAEAGDFRRRVFQSRAYAAGVRGNSHCVAELALASVNQGIGNAYSLSNYNGQ